MLGKFFKDPWFLCWGIVCLISAGAVGYHLLQMPAQAPAPAVPPATTASAPPPAPLPRTAPAPPPVPPAPLAQPIAPPAVSGAGFTAPLQSKTPGHWIVDSSRGKNSDTPSISQAVLNAKDGDTIEIRPGTYIDNLVVDKALTFIGKAAGNQRPVVQNDGQNKQSPLTVNGGVVKVEDLNFDQVMGYDMPTNQGNAIVLRSGKLDLTRVQATSKGTPALYMQSGSLKAQDGDFRGYIGINAESGYVACTRCVASRNTVMGFLFGPANADLREVKAMDNGEVGLTSFKATINIVNSEFAQNMQGLNFTDGSSISLNNVNVHHNHNSGIQVIDSRGGIDGSKMSHNSAAGLSLKGHSDLVVKKVEVSDNDDFGIILEPASRLHLYDSLIFHNSSSGVFAESQSEAKLQRCKVYQNSSGLDARGGSVKADLCEIFQNKVNGAQTRHGELEVRNSQIYENGSGGVYGEEDATIKLESTQIYRNLGGVAADHANIQVLIGEIYDQTGDAIQLRAGTFRMSDTKVHDNDTGIFAEQKAKVELNNCRFERNKRKDYTFVDPVDVSGSGNQPPLPVQRKLSSSGK